MNLNKSTNLGLAIGVLLLGAAGVSSAAEIRWQSGAEATGGKTPGQLSTALTDLAGRPQARHAVVQLLAPVTPATRAALAAHGVALQQFIGDNAFFATVDPNGLDAAWVSGSVLVADVLPMQRRWRLHPYLEQGQFPQWAVVAPTKQADDAEEDIIVALYVTFHSDVRLAPDGVNTLFRHGARLQSKLTSINSAVIEIPFGRISALADEDAVSWIEPALPKFSELNNSNREITGANTVQAPPYNLDGTGVGVLVYDGGRARASHVDFNGRLSNRDNSGSSDHATHVSGTIGGSGQASGGQFRGMAPGVTIESYGFEQEGGLSMGFLYTDPGDIQLDYTEAINVFGADIANNSIGTNTAPNGFPCEWEGNYSVTSAMIDTIVRGGFSNGEPFRIIWANGNERGSGACGSTYHTTAPPACAKNHITVGALNSNDDSMTGFSSWGPCDDGRMKPDVSAPGCQSDGDGTVTSCSNSSDTAYTGKCGTSMASPTVTGVSALLLQDYRVQFPGEPDMRNSTLKALLAHTCVDLGNEGPDYKTGFGSVRIQPAIDLMRAGNFLEDQVSQGEVFSALVVVNPGESFQVTLAWDDPPAAANVIPILVNDLDLVVLDPQGVQQFPWTLDPNNPSAPATRNQADHVNNIEQVRAAFSTPGTWQIQVHGINVPEGPQAFSLAASPLLIQCSTIGNMTMDRAQYMCDSVATLRVVDCDLNTSDQTVETVEVSITSDSEPSGELVLLTETAPETATFSAPIALATTDAPGELLVLDGDQITVTYVDADDGVGNTNVPVSAIAISDCQAPIIFNVTDSAVGAFTATIGFGTDEPTTGVASYGIVCGLEDGSASSGVPASTHSVQLTGLSENTTYFYWVNAQDPAGNPASDDNGGLCYSFVTDDIPDYFTEEFGSDNDLDFQTITFTPNGTGDFYAGCSEPADALPTPTAGATPVSLTDDSSSARALTGGQTVSLYGVAYSTAHVGSNGYVTFTTGDTDFSETLADHFDLPRISGLFDDLNPGNGGTIYWQQLSDRAVVTYLDVPEFSNTGSNTFQIEMFFDGMLRVTYLAISASDGIAGLSAGLGIPPGFVELDLSASNQCIPLEAPPTIVQQPVDETVCENGSALFSVVAGGTGPLSYQWFFNGVAISGATFSILSVPNATIVDEGAYAVEIVNGFGATFSDPALLDVILPIECDDTNACTVDSCAAAACVNTNTTPADQCCNPDDGGLIGIDDFNACTTDVCLPNGSVTHNDNFNPATQCCNTLNGAIEPITDLNACTDDLCNVDGSVSHDDNFDVATQCCDPSTGAVLLIDDADACTQDACDSATGIVTNSVQTPLGADLGSKSISATPAACADQVAIRVTSDDFPCLSLYVAADGTLSATPVFQTPGVWGTVVLRGEEIVPESSYLLQSETMGGVLSAATPVTTWNWGDLDNDGIVNFQDILFIVLVFQGNLTHATLEAADLEPCTPNQTVNLADIQRGVGAFQQMPYSAVCPIPCP